MEAQAEEVTPKPWFLFTDGSSCLEGSGARLILTGPKGEEFTYALRFEFNVSNNEAEYEALVASLRIMEQMGVKNLVAKVDSRIVANQINGSYEAKEQSMIQYLENTKALIDNFKLRPPHQTSPGRNTEEKINRRKRNPCHYGRRRELLDDTINRVPGERHPTGRNKEDTRNQDQTKAVRLDSDYQEKSYPTMKSSSATTHSKTDAKSSISSKVEIGMPSLRCAEINQAENDEGLLLNLDILEERREKAAVREARSKAKMEKYYNAKVHSTTFCPGVFVIHSNKASHAKESGKLGPKWEGPYEVVEALRKRAEKAAVREVKYFCAHETSKT
ncbi:reverse transcriptase domain-containing protein [Tanacetum coccineum]